MSEVDEIIKELKDGDIAPDFITELSGGKEINLASFLGKNIILFFYPRDNTPGCTLEAKEFSDNIETFNKLNTVVFGISRDSLKSHNKFSLKFDLAVSLMSDHDSEISEKYGVLVDKTSYGREYRGIERSTFLINAEGKIQKIWRKVKVKGHVGEVLKELNGNVAR